jgi:hypothetical protein
MGPKNSLPDPEWPSPVLIQSDMFQFHTFLPHFPKIYFNAILLDIPVGLVASAFPLIDVYEYILTRVVNI